METYILRENVVSDNVLMLCNENEIFKLSHGRYIAIIKEYSYANAWTDKETIKRFRKRETLYKYLNKNYPTIEIYN
jgi:hypothetical protein